MLPGLITQTVAYAVFVDADINMFVLERTGQHSTLLEYEPPDMVVFAVDWVVPVNIRARYSYCEFSEVIVGVVPVVPETVVIMLSQYLYAIPLSGSFP